MNLDRRILLAGVAITGVTSVASIADVRGSLSQACAERSCGSADAPAAGRFHGFSRPR